MDYISREDKCLLVANQVKKRLGNAVMQSYGYGEKKTEPD